MNDNQNFAFDPPEMNDQQIGRFPGSGHEAWMLQLIKTKLNDLDIEDEFKKQFLNEIVHIIDGAGMTQVRRGEVRLFLGKWEELWMKFKIFKCKRKHYKQINYIKTFIENLLLQNYNRSIDGWQGDHVFEQKTSYNVKQTQDMQPTQSLSWREKRKLKKQQKQQDYEVVPQ